MEGPRAVKENEYDELLALVDEIFLGRRFRSVQSTWPTVYGYDVRELENHRVIVDDGRLVSHLVIVPREVDMVGCSLRVGGIGGVGTLDAYRNRGFASALVKDSIEKMRHDGMDISFLLGLRHRYVRWGWELGGQSIKYSLTERSLPFFEVFKGRVWRYMGDLDDINAVVAAHNRESLRVKRSKSAYYMLFAVPSTEAWFCELDNGSFAYMVLRCDGDARSVLEVGGDASAFSTLTKTLMERFELREMSIVSPVVTTSVSGVLWRAASEWSVQPIGYIKIINLYSTLTKLAPYLQKRLAALDVPFEADIGICMKSACDNQEERVTLQLKQDVQVLQGCRMQQIVLDERDMVQLLFGLERPTRTLGFSGRLGALLDLLFPIPLYLSRLDYIDFG